MIGGLLPAAAAVAVLGSVESLLSAVVADGMVGAGERHNPNRELFGQGIANLISPVHGRHPGDGGDRADGGGRPQRRQLAADGRVSRAHGARSHARCSAGLPGTSR